MIFFSYIIDVDCIIEQDAYECQTWSNDFYLAMTHLHVQRANQLLYLNCGDTHFSVVGNKGQVYQWGMSDCFQLGLPLSTRSGVSTITHAIDQALPDISWFQHGSNHTLAYSKTNNRLLAWGDNSQGQLGQDHFQSLSKVVDLSRLIKPGTTVVALDCRANQSCVVLSDGTSFIWPCMMQDRSVSSLPLYAAFNKEKVSQVALGFEFSVFLINNGTLYTMGHNNVAGELGTGDFLPRYVPTKLMRLAKSGQVVAQVSCGFKHTVARTTSGKVYTWGWGERGQLGHGDDSNLPEPQMVKIKLDIFTNCACSYIQAGYRATFALMENKKLLWWGSTGRLRKQTTPRKYEDPEDEIYFMRSDFRPIKVLTSWSKTISVTTLLMADVRYLTGETSTRTDMILKQVQKEWGMNERDSKRTLT